MSAPAGLQPILLRDAVFAVAGDDFSASVMGVAFVPQVDWEWFNPMDSTVALPIYGVTKWTVTIGYAQDLRPGSLTRYLFEQAASTRTIVFTPQPGLSGPPVTAEAMIVPGPLGGTVQDGVLTATVTLPLFDEPTIGEG